jgi:GNAT superfamily N-acetyltransferase
MTLQVAGTDDFARVRAIVRKTIETVYSSFYPEDVVRFFLDYQGDDAIREDIAAGRLYVLTVDGVMVGTGSLHGNEICRVFVLPEYSHRGFGTMIMRELESIVSRSSRTARLDSSLPGYGLYLKLGYRPVDYQMISTPNGQVLCYHVMEKPLVAPFNLISADADAGVPCYDGRQFLARSADPRAIAATGALFRCHQDGAAVWAEYAGGPILRGYAIGTVASRGELELAYEHLDREALLYTGRGAAVPEILADGRLRLRFRWIRTNGDCSSGETILEEVR